jgi:hypothetical protein
MFQPRLPNARDVGFRLRARAQSPVEPAMTVCHRGALARRSTPRFRAAAGSRREVAAAD